MPRSRRRSTNQRAIGLRLLAWIFFVCGCLPARSIGVNPTGSGPASLGSESGLQRWAPLPVLAISRNSTHGRIATAIRFLSIRRIPSRWMSHSNDGGILGQSLKKGNPSVASSPHDRLQHAAVR
jgi:hypothetical protein